MSYIIENLNKSKWLQVDRNILITRFISVVFDAANYFHSDVSQTVFCGICLSQIYLNSLLAFVLIRVVVVVVDDDVFILTACTIDRLASSICSCFV